MILLTVGKRLEMLRKEAGYKTQIALTEVIDITSASLSNYENGKREIPQEWLIKFAIFFNVSVDYILGLTEIKHITALRDEVFIEVKNKGITNGELCTKLSGLSLDNKEIVYKMIDTLATHNVNQAKRHFKLSEFDNLK